MKRAFALSFFLILLFASLQSSYAASYELTTRKTILFNGIPWDVDSKQFKEILQEKDFAFSSFYIHLLNPSSSSYGDGKIVQVSYSDNVRTKVYTADNVKNGYRKNVGEVAGHSVDGIVAKFFDSTNLLYEIKISIGRHEDVTAEEQYNDLVVKLTNLYGSPYTYTTESSYSIGKYEDFYCVWLGNSGTSVYVQRSHNLEKNHQYPLDYVTLYYGLTSSYDQFKEEEEAFNNMQAKKKSEAISGIQDNYSGL